MIDWLIRSGFWIPFALCSYLAVTPSPPDSVFRISDVILHGFAFVYLSFTLKLVHPALSLSRVALLMLAYGGLIELIQGMTPPRQAEWADLLVDAIGIAVGLGLWQLSGKWIRQLLNRLLQLLGLSSATLMDP